jgi:hypothetical protein
MNKNFIVPLEATPSDKEIYRASDENLVRVRVFMAGRAVPAQDVTVELALSRDAMLALGSELIRAAMKTTRPQDSWEIAASSSDNASEVLGVYGHPETCKLVVNKQPLGKVAELIG